MTTAPARAVGDAGGRPGQFPLVLGLDTFGDVTHDDDDRPLSHAQTIRDLVEQGVRADEVGGDCFGIGEHHTDDFPLSAADVVLAAIAARTTRIRGGSAVTVSSSDDPVRVFQRYSTLDAISCGRARGHPRTRLQHRPKRAPGPALPWTCGWARCRRVMVIVTVAVPELPLPSLAV